MHVGRGRVLPRVKDTAPWQASAFLLTGTNSGNVRNAGSWVDQPHPTPSACSNTTTPKGREHPRQAPGPTSTTTLPEVCAICTGVSRLNSLGTLGVQRIWGVCVLEDGVNRTVPLKSRVSKLFFLTLRLK